MGMFDWIDYEMDCPLCQNRVTEFQSKDGPCELYTLKPWNVNSFYSSCDNCYAWLEYQTIEPWDHMPRNPPDWLEKYRLTASGGS